MPNRTLSLAFKFHPNLFLIAAFAAAIIFVSAAPAPVKAGAAMNIASSARTLNGLIVLAPSAVLLLINLPPVRAKVRTTCLRQLRHPLP